MLNVCLNDLQAIFTRLYYPRPHGYLTSAYVTRVKPPRHKHDAR